jgi:tetratricopeptide (TPR) repeat protein
MSYQEEEQAKLKRVFSKQAISLAMQGRWREAVVANESLIENFPNDINAYNRLGKAYMELGEYSLAKEAYSRAAELDPYNTIAKKNILRLSRLGGAPAGSADDSHKAEPQYFIEEAGKSGVVSLYHLAPPEVVAKMVAGDRVYLQIRGSDLIVENRRGEYIGEVEPRHGRRLIRLMEGGNQYTAAIISSTEEMVTIIIREIYQDPSQVGQLSFPAKGGESVLPYVGERIIRRELENEEAMPEEPGYTIISGDETELLPEELVEEDKDYDEEEE